MRRRLVALCGLVGITASLLVILVTAGNVAASIRSVPTLAYYYIWFDEASWNRAKIDYPILGRYTSDDATVMEQHVKWAKAAGIDGFIVSWKSTPTLDDRLAKLIHVADEQQFKLVVIYQALDFTRQPLGIEKIRADLTLFAAQWSADPAFKVFDKPTVILSGTWELSHEELTLALGSLRSQLFILASERDVEGYERVADLVDGDAYYWSSVNPDVDSGAPEKLDSLGEAVHGRDGLWIAPAAPGFDARLIGGTRVVPRKGGDTLRAEIGAALESSPDALGVISWNEFSENSHVEPSVTYGGEALETLADVAGLEPPSGLDVDSSDSPGSGAGLGPERLIAFAGVGLLLLVSIASIASRRRASRPDAPSLPERGETSSDSPS
jgi:hypothetical protein